MVFILKLQSFFLLISQKLFWTRKIQWKKTPTQQHTVIASEFNYLENKDHDDEQRMKNAMP